MWTLIFPHHKKPTHGYAARREVAMAAFASASSGNDLEAGPVSCEGRGAALIFR
jgi:hypothetical protein